LSNNYFFFSDEVNNSIYNEFFFNKSFYSLFSNLNKNIVIKNLNFIKNYSLLNFVQYYGMSPTLQSFVTNPELIKKNNFNFFLLNNFIKSENSNIRKNASNLIADYKSLQKVFKLRFDDLKAHTSTKYLSSSFNKHLDLVHLAPKYGEILKKNMNYFVSVNSFKVTNINNNNNLFLNFNSLNTYYYDFPFLVAQQSDQIRSI
jgi:hypothetical protein